MKITTGFVSNSSSTSFCIYGILIDPEDLRTQLKKKFEENYLPPEALKIRKQLHKDYPDGEGGIDWEEVDLYDALDSDNLAFYSDDNSYYLGSRWCDVRDDQTGREFKQEAYDMLSSLGLVGSPDDLETINETVQG